MSSQTLPRVVVLPMIISFKASIDGTTNQIIIYSFDLLTEQLKEASKKTFISYISVRG